MRVRVLACDSRATREGCQVARERHCTQGIGQAFIHIPRGLTSVLKKYIMNLCPGKNF